jgi:hypothetical protein
MMSDRVMLQLEGRERRWSLRFTSRSLARPKVNFGRGRSASRRDNDHQGPRC